MIINKKHLLEKFYELNIGIYFDWVKDLAWAKVYTSDYIEEEYNNHAVVYSFEKNFDSRISQIEKVLHSRNRKAAVYVPDFSKPKNIERNLMKNDYAVSFKDAWMFLKDHHILPDQKTKNVRHIGNDPGLILEFENISSQAYGGSKTDDNPYGGIPMQGFIKAAKKGLAFKNRMEGYVLRHGGACVSCAILLFDKEAGYIANVATLPKFRNQGFGTLITNYAAKRSISMGHKYTFLATEYGSAVEQFYKKMGYETRFTGECLLKSS